MIKYQFKIMLEFVPVDEWDFWGTEGNTFRIVRWIGPSVEIPLILHVCRESRQEALTDFEAGLEISPGGRQTYWNPKLDTVFLVKETSRHSSSTLIPLNEIPARARQKIQYLAIDLNNTTISYTDDKVKDQLSSLIGFTSLKSLTLVVDPVPPKEPKSRTIFREPLDDPIVEYDGATPTAIEQRFENILEDIRAENPDWKPPTVRVMVVLWGTRKKTWCIGSKGKCKYISSDGVLHLNTTC
jgi:hypothetical protein